MIALPVQPRHAVPSSRPIVKEQVRETRPGIGLIVADMPRWHTLKLLPKRGQGGGLAARPDKFGRFWLFGFREAVREEAVLAGS